LTIFDYGEYFVIYRFGPNPTILKTKSTMIHSINIVWYRFLIGWFDFFFWGRQNRNFRSWYK